MSFTPEEVRKLESADSLRGWPEIPASAPAEVRSRILQYRAKRLGIAPATEEDAETQAQLAAYKSL